MKPAPSVCQSVSLSVCLWQKFSYFPPLDFSDFLQEVSLNKCRKVTKPDFWKKMCLQIIMQFVSKIAVFGHFLEIASLDFAKNVRNDRE